MQTVPRRGTCLQLLLSGAVALTASLVTASFAASVSPRGRSVPVAPAQFQEGSYRGYAVESFGAGYAVPELELAAATPQALRLAINGLLFRAATGIVDSEREAVYSAADLDRDGRLSRDEQLRCASALGSLPGATTAELRLYWGQ